MGYSWVLILLLVIAFVIYRVYRRGTELRGLTEHGVSAMGEVLLVQHFHIGPGSTRFLRYQFRALNGDVYSRKIAMSVAQAERYRDGGAIEIVYLPQNPKVSAVKDMVEYVRKGLEKRR